MRMVMLTMTMTMTMFMVTMVVVMRHLRTEMNKCLGHMNDGNSQHSETKSDW